MPEDRWTALVLDNSAPVSGWAGVFQGIMVLYSVDYFLEVAQIPDARHSLVNTSRPPLIWSPNAVSIPDH